MIRRHRRTNLPSPLPALALPRAGFEPLEAIGVASRSISGAKYSKREFCTTSVGAQWLRPAGRLKCAGLISLPLNVPAHKETKMLVREPMLKALKAAMETDNASFRALYKFQ